MLSYPTTQPRGAALGLTILCLLAALSIGRMTTCGPAQLSASLPKVTSVPAPKPDKPPGQIDPAIPLLALSRAPEPVRRVVEHLRSVRHWNPLKGYRGGKLFANREGLLPRGITYREYDLRPAVQGINRGVERLVVSADRSNFYYTADHYRTFTKITLP